MAGADSVFFAGRGLVNNSQAESRMPSNALSTATDRPLETAFAPAQTTDARQHARIATPVLLLRPRKTISAIRTMNASAHPE